MTFKSRLLERSAAIAVDKSPVIWYHKASPVQVVYSRQTGFVTLDHVRRTRSEALPTLTAALNARGQILKDIAHELSSAPSGLQAP